MIMDFSVSMTKTSEVIQGIAGRCPEADKYCTDGYAGYLDTIFPGEQIRNMRDKKDTAIFVSVVPLFRQKLPNAGDF